VDIFTVTSPPGFSGPEVIHRQVLPAGTTFQVLGVRRCTNCPFEERVELLVRVLGTDEYQGAPVKVNLGLVESGALVVPDNVGGTPH
jgi:hypothetical protein